MWYGSYTRTRKEWSDWTDSTASGCLAQYNRNTSKRLTIIDYASDETGGRVTYMDDAESIAVRKRNECSGCVYSSVEKTRNKANGSSAGALIVYTDISDNYAAIEFEALDEIPSTSTRDFSAESSCAAGTKSSSSTPDTMLVSEITDGFWRTGPTPGSVIVYGSSSTSGSYSPTHHWAETVTWRFSNRPDVRLVLDAVGLDTWRPEATLWDGQGTEPVTPGNTLQVTATLKPRPSTSSQTLPKATKITFKLESSLVPGTSMNSPLEGPENSPQDLQFEQARNANLVFVSKNQVHTAPGLVEDASATLSSFDWGAYGEITAEAVLQDGSTLIGRFRDTGEAMRIPKRPATSYIADVWKANAGVAGQEDSADKETVIGGDGHSGDGLTLYEEYRGLTASGARVGLDPTKVDFHVYHGFKGTDAATTDKRNQVIAGLHQFESLVGLKVHFAYDSADFEFSEGAADTDPSKRIINFNALDDGGRHRTNQHVVMITPSQGTSTIQSKAHNGPSTPANISRVELSSAVSLTDLAWTTLHELGHTANLPHHGDDGEKRVYWELQPTGRVLEKATASSTSGTLIDVYLESSGAQTGLSLSQEMIVSVQVTDSQKGSLFGGDEDCVMRQPIATAVQWAGKPADRRYIIKPLEARGTTLCTAREGKTFNAIQSLYPNGEVHPVRHGSAAPGRGECRRKLCVNDFYGHPPRYGLP